MATIQICALITIITAAALLYWTGYRGGRADRRIEDTHNQRDEHAHNIHKLEASLQAIRANHQRLTRHWKKLKTKMALSREHHQTLLDIAENLRIAAETFSAFRTDQKLERDTRTLRDQALTMAALVDPAITENAA